MRISRPRTSVSFLVSSLLVSLVARTQAAGAAESVLVDFQSPMRYLVQTAAGLGTSWTLQGFSDAGWTDGTYGVGYDAGAMIQTTVSTTALSAYTRARFDIADLAAVETIWFAADYDDGYVAWINGVPIARANMPNDTPEFDTEAASHESSNGAVPTFSAFIDVTAKAKPALIQGENILAVGVWNNDPPSSDLALVPRLSINRPVTPPTEIHWTLAGSPYVLASDLTIARGAILRIDPGVQVRAASGVEILVEGQIFAEGTAEAPIGFDREAASGTWDGILIDHDGDGVPRASTIRFATLRNATTLIDVDATGDSEILIEDCTLDSWTSVAFHWDNGANALRINRCRVGLDTPVADQNREAVNGYRSSAILENSFFGPRRGYNDTIDLADTKWGGPVPIVRFNEVLPGEDDGIDFDDCDGYIIGNFVHGRRPPADFEPDEDCPQYPVAGSGANGGGITGNEGSRPVVMNNIVYDCFHGIGYKNGADPLIANNTIVGCTWGIVLFETSDIADPALANGTLANNVIWDCDVPIRLRWCDTGPLSTVDVQNCLVPGGYAGQGNIDAAETPLAAVADPANPARADFRLRDCSPAIDAGLGGPLSWPHHAESVPTLDAAGLARVDLETVANTGRGAPIFTDIGAFESQGPDACGTTPPARFLRGEANGDGSIDLTDAVAVLFVLFAGLESNCEDALDCDDSGQLDTTDAVFLLEYLFRGGAAPPAPAGSPGVDPTEDGDPLGCERK